MIGSPEYVNGDFDCSVNKLIYLKGSPNIVKGNFICHTNNLSSIDSLNGGPEYILGTLFCDRNPYGFNIDDVSKFCKDNGIKLYNLPYSFWR